MKTNIDKYIYEPHKSSIFGWNANIVAALTYWIFIVFCFIPKIGFIIRLIIGLISPLFVLLAEKDSELVKKHAKQCLILNFAPIILTIITFIVCALFAYFTSIGSSDPTAGQAYGWIGVLLLPFILMGSFVYRVIGTIEAVLYRKWVISVDVDWINNLGKQNGR